MLSHIVHISYNSSSTYCFKGYYINLVDSGHHKFDHWGNNWICIWCKITNPDILRIFLHMAHNHTSLKIRKNLFHILFYLSITNNSMHYCIKRILQGSLGIIMIHLWKFYLDKLLNINLHRDNANYQAFNFLIYIKFN